MQWLIFRCYNVLLYLLAPFILWRHYKACPEIKKWPALRQRLGRKSSFPKADIWLHCASAGEARALIAAADILNEHHLNLSLLATTQTKAGLEILQKAAPSNVTACLMPFDFSWAVRSCLMKVKPALVIVLEQELWPNLFKQCQRMQRPLFLLSFRVDHGGYQRYLQVRSLYAPLLNSVACIATQRKSDTNYLKKLNLAHPSRIKTSGNLKLCWKAKNPKLAKMTTQTQWLVAGNTHDPEEDIWLELIYDLTQSFPQLKLALAPRKIERAHEIIEKALKFNLSVKTGTHLKDQMQKVLVIDRMGVLLDAYAHAQICYVGGSLSYRAQGHNLYEPCQLGKGCIFGNRLGKWQEDGERIVKAKAGIMVASSKELGLMVKTLLKSSQRRSMLAHGAEKMCQEQSQKTRHSYESILHRISINDRTDASQNAL